MTVSNSDPSAQQPFHFTHMTIIGNAKGEVSLPEQGYAVTFNGTTIHHPNVMNICNGPYAQSQKSFVVSNSPNNEWFEQQLDVVANSIKQQIGCWPSSGLVTVILMSLLSDKVDVTRMALLPSLRRDESLAPQTHLPCVVHNWLGERRIALGLALTNNHINWPELFLAPLMTPMDDEQTKALVDANIELANPYELLANLTTEPKPPAAPMMLAFQQQILKQCAQLPTDQWLTMASTAHISDVEMLFVTPDAEKQQPSAWFLTDSKVNQYLDPIRHHLAYCQQLIAIANQSRAQHGQITQ